MPDLRESLDLLSMSTAASDRPSYAEKPLRQFEEDLPYLAKFSELLASVGVTMENSPNTYRALLSMWEKSGKPEFKTAEEYKTSFLGSLQEKFYSNTKFADAPHYVPEFKSFLTGGSDRGQIIGAKSPKIMIEEMAHGYQYHDKPLLENILRTTEGGLEGILGGITGLFSDKYSSAHDIPYTMEWRAHEQISPPMYEEYMSALAEDLMNTERAYHGENVAGYEGSNALQYLNNLISWQKKQIGWYEEAYETPYHRPEYQEYKAEEDERIRLGLENSR